MARLGMVIDTRRCVGCMDCVVGCKTENQTPEGMNRALYERNILGLENLTNLDRLPPRGAWVMALPMKIGGGSGAPVRVVAVVPVSGT